MVEIQMSTGGSRYVLNIKATSDGSLEARNDARLHFFHARGQIYDALRYLQENLQLNGDIGAQADLPFSAQILAAGFW